VTRLPVAAFAALVTTTAAAFFTVQHLKVATPLLAGFPRPVPAGINPVSGTWCYDPAVGKTLNYRVMTISFYLLHQSDEVDVWVTDRRGHRVATLAAGAFMPGGNHPVRKQFVWNGYEPGRVLAPDGEYFVKVHLVHQARTVTISDNTGPIPFRVITTPPRPRITLVTPHVIHASRPRRIRIDYTGNGSRLVTIQLYRLDSGHRPRLVKSFVTGGHSAVWDGRIRRHPASPGTYYVGLQVTDLACDTARFPPTLHPLPSRAAAIEVTVLP
jgi:hypothetical protein